jgi:hypothetical protein
MATAAHSIRGFQMIRVLRFAALAAAIATTPAMATMTADPVGDFEHSYVGPHVADADITGVDASFDGTNFHLSVTTAGDIGTTPGVFYVWGYNRGSGVPRLQFVGAPPAIKPYLKFDGVDLTFPFGLSVVGGQTFPPSFDNYWGLVTVTGNRLDAILPAALVPSAGFDFAHYQFTVWAHVPVDPDDSDPSNARIADFSRTVTINGAIPEPASWALMIAGFGLAGAALRRQRGLATA